MPRLQTVLNRMPQHFAHDKNSNNYKLLSIIAENSSENRSVYETMLRYWDIDKAEGVALDRLGKDEGIKRGSWDDEEYRKMIKIQCILNLSEGDIDTMNTILEAYIGDDYIGLEEGWIRYNKPATLMIEKKASENSLALDLIKRVKPAGVGIIQVEVFNKDSKKVRNASVVLSGEIVTIFPYYAHNPIEAKGIIPVANYSHEIETTTICTKGVNR